MSKVLSLIFLIVLVVTLGTAATSLGLLSHNSLGGICALFLNDEFDPAGTVYDSKGARAACGISSTTAVLATIGLTVASFIEFNKLVFGSTVNNIGFIIQAMLIIVSVVCQLITAILTAAGWAQTCNKLQISCTGYDSITFAGGEFIAAGVLSGLGFILGIGALALFIVKKVMDKGNETYTDKI